MKTKKVPGYYVTTYNYDKGDYTPQKGVRTGPWTLWGLRRAIRMLRFLGYMGTRSDNDVFIEKVPRTLSTRKAGLP